MLGNMINICTYCLALHKYQVTTQQQCKDLDLLGYSSMHTGEDTTDPPSAAQSMDLALASRDSKNNTIAISIKGAVSRTLKVRGQD